MHLTNLIAALGQIVRPEAIITDTARLQPFQHDWVPGDYRAPDLVVYLDHPDQVPALVALVAAAGLPIVARGAGTGLAGGARPSHGGVVLVTTRLNQIERVDLENRQALVQPGLITYELSAALKPQGWFYAPDPASWRMCTIGGNIANNSGGPRCLKYGVTTNHLLAVEVVLHDGRRFWTGDGVQDAAGYDLTGLIVGSEGTFGLVTRALVRLSRLPEANRVVMALFPDVVAACAAVSAILAAGHLPTALEVMDATTMRAVNLAQNAGLPETAGAALIIEIDGVCEGLDEALAELVAICEHHGAIDLHTAATPEAQEQIWSARRSAFASFHTLAPSYYLVDTVVPRTRLPAMMAHVQRLSAQYALPIANVFHAGDGNLHPLVLYDPADPAQVAKAHAITVAILEQSIAEGGAVSGEHGIGVEKQDFLARLYGPDELAAQAAVYAVFNPDNRLNPGKVFPRDCDPLTLAAARREALMTPPSNRDPARLRGELATLLGEDHCLAGKATNSYAIQGHRPGCVVLPGSLAELSAVMAACHSVGATVVPWGGGTRQSIGRLAEAPDVVLVTRRLNAVLHYEPDDLTIGVGAGMTLAELQTLLAKHNQQLPLEAADGARATLGGLVATAADGPRRAGYGTLRDWVLGLTVVQVDGTVLRLGGQVVKNVSGYDLVKLFIGSYGTLGLIAEVRLRTFPQAAATASLVAAFSSHAALDGTLRTLAGSILRPTAVDYLDLNTLAALGLSGTCGLAIGFEGSAPACRRQAHEAVELAVAHDATALLIEEGGEQGRIWKLAAAQTAPASAQEGWALRLAVPPAQFVEALADLERLATTHGLALISGGRALDGVILGLLRGEQEAVGTLQADLVQRWPHTHILAGELPPAIEPLRWGRPACELAQELVGKLKDAFDPYGRLNPGRFITKDEG